MPAQKPIRILQVVGGMNRGGAETWLMHVLRHIDRDRFQMDFLVHTTRESAYDREIRQLGSRVIPCMRPSRPWDYALNFRRILREHGPYDIVHSHVHHYSGWVLLLANQAGVPIRIAHSHNDTSGLQASASFPRRLYLAATRRWIDRHATLGLACSRRAAAALFGERWSNDRRWQILYYGIDLAPFQQPTDRAAVRAELGIRDEDFVVGHVGRFQEQKNHRFLVEIAAEVAKREPRTRLLLVGDGPLRPEIERHVAGKGLASRAIFAGVRTDVPRLLLGAVDVFVLPSLWEGLPLVGLEAQAAGLPIILSDVISDELDLFGHPIQRLPLSVPPSVWAEHVLRSASRGGAKTRQEGLDRVMHSDFRVAVSAAALQSIYSRHDGKAEVGCHSYDSHSGIGRCSQSSRRSAPCR